MGLLVIFLLLMGHMGMAAAQQPASKLRRIGYLTQASETGAGYEMFRQELRNLGYVEGNNVAIEYRSAETQPHLDRLATSFLKKKVDVIVTVGGRATRTVQKATKTVPIVFTLSGDPNRKRFCREPCETGSKPDGYHLDGV